jgi:hypothetical protein
VQDAAHGRYTGDGLSKIDCDVRSHLGDRILLPKIRD